MQLRLLRLTILLILVALWPAAGSAARLATPSTVGTARLDLAAMALTPGDVPAGFFDDYSEWWVPAGAIDGIIGEATAPAGLVDAYQSFFVANDLPLVVNIFLLEFDSPESASAGAGIVDSVLRPPLPDGTSTGPIREAGPAIAGSPGTMTSALFDTRENGGPFVSVVASSFVHDAIVGGASIESYVDPPAGGSPIPESTPTGIDPAAQAQLATQLGSILDTRIAAVLADNDPGGVDRSLPVRVLPLQQLVSADTPVLGGYEAGADLLECRVCGEESPLGAFAGHDLGGFVRMVSVGSLVDGEPSPPFIGVAVSEFETGDDALAVLGAIRAEPNDLPTAYPVPRGERTIAADPAIPGADAAVAYTAILDPDDPVATVDSAGVTIVQDAYLVTIDVQGGLTADQAMGIATDLAAQRALCLGSTEPCSSVVVAFPSE